MSASAALTGGAALSRSAPLSLLAIESSGRGCAAAVWQSGRVTAARRIALDQGHAAALMPLIRDSMADVGLAWRALGRIAVTVGPGSFTGIRVGLAAARGLGLALGIPVGGITSFELLARSIPAADRAGAGGAVLIDSGRSSLYLQRFDEALAPLGEPVSVEPDQLAGLLPAAPDWIVTSRDLPPAVADARRIVAGALDAAVLATLAAARHAAGQPFLPASPLYLRPPDATVPRGGGRIRG